MNTLHYIGGRWQPAQDDRCFEVRNPADDSLIAEVSEGSSADARLAADAAALALPAWKARPPRERCLILKKWHALIERDVEPLAQGIVAWHKELAPAGDTTCIVRDSAFADDVAKTNLAVILEQYGIQNVRSL